MQVPLISVGQPVNESVQSFAISSWSEIAYHDPSLTQYQFKIAEDLIYDIANDTFAGESPALWQLARRPAKCPCLLLLSPYEKVTRLQNGRHFT